MFTPIIHMKHINQQEYWQVKQSILLIYYLYDAERLCFLEKMMSLKFRC